MTQAQAEIQDMPAPQAQSSLSAPDEAVVPVTDQDAGGAAEPDARAEDEAIAGDVFADDVFAGADSAEGAMAAEAEDDEPGLHEGGPDEDVTDEDMTDGAADDFAAEDEFEDGDDDFGPPGAPPVDVSVDDMDPMRVLEALLFAASVPLSTSAIRERMPKNADVGGLLMELQQIYEGRGVHLVEMDGTWAFRTAADLGDALMINREVKRKLSRAAMETLAIVAYHQPVTRAEIESIRGVATHKGTLDVLIEAGWVKPGRRRETPGRPLTWVTTVSFLDQFGLEAITDLPGLEELKASGLLDRRPAIETLGGTGDLFGDDLSEAEASGDAGDDAEDDAYDHLAPDDPATARAGAETEAEGSAADFDADPDNDSDAESGADFAMDSAVDAAEDDDTDEADFDGDFAGDEVADDEGER